MRIVACECGKLRVAVPKNIRVALACPSCPRPLEPGAVVVERLAVGGKPTQQ